MRPVLNPWSTLGTPRIFAWSVGVGIDDLSATNRAQATMPVVTVADARAHVVDSLMQTGQLAQGPASHLSDWPIAWVGPVDMGSYPAMLVMIDLDTEHP